MTKNILSASNEKQTLASIFAELSLNKKNEYLVDQYGTVKGTTGFFDYRYRQHVHSVKEFLLQDGSQATVCVVCNGGSYESGGGDMSNHVMVIIGDKKYTTESFKYSDLTYYVGGGSNEKGQTTKEYKDIISLNYDPISAICAIVVDTPIGEQTIETTASKAMKFDDALLGKLYVPADVQMEDISAEAAKEILSTLNTPEDYSTQDMYIQTLELYKEQGDISMIRDLVFGERSRHHHGGFKIPIQEPSVTLDPYVQQVLDQYIKNSYNSKKFDDFFGCKKMISMLHSPDLKKMYIDQLFDLMKAYPDMDTIKHFVDDFLSELEGDGQEHYQQLFDASYMVMDISSRREEPIGFIDLLAANKIENYQRLYDAYIKRGGALANIGHHSSGSYMDNRRREIQFFADRGVVITQEAFQDIASLDAYQKLRNLRNILDSLPLWKEEYPLFVTDDMIQCIVDNNTADNALDQYEYDTSSRSHDTLKFLELWKALHREYNVLYTTTYYQLVYKNFNTESIQASILENDDSNKTVGQLFLELISNDKEIYAKKKCMRFNWFLDNGYIVDESLFQSIFLKMFEDPHLDVDQLHSYQEKYVFLQTDENKENLIAIADNKIADMYHYTNLKYIPYASIDAIKVLLLDFVSQETDRIGRSSSIQDVLQIFFERDDLTSAYASELATKLYTNGLHKQLKQLIESIGLKLDKSLILGWVQELLQQEEFKTAEFLVNAAGLEERMMKHIIIMKLQQGWNLSRDNERFIKADDELKKLYTASQLNSLVTAGNLTKALELAYNNDVVLTPDHFAKYRQGKIDRIEEAKQQKIEAEQQKQLEIKQRIEQTKDLQSMFDAGNYLVDINRKRDQKFVFGSTEEEGPFVLSQPLERHRDIVKAADRSDDQILGGGWIKVNNEAKTVILYASSGSYGAVYPEFHQLVISVIQQQYTDYTVQRK